MTILEPSRQATDGRVAVIGAGMSGLTCATGLRDAGFDVVVFDKGRGLGGRTATRRAEPGLSFDHGAQYFTARDPRFLRHVESWVEQGIAAEWTGRIVAIDETGTRPTSERLRRYVGVPGMTAIARHLGRDLDVRLETRVVRLERDGGGWSLVDAAGQIHGPFRFVVVSLPAPQAADLVGDHPLGAELRAVPMTPCWAVMAAFARRVEAAWDGAFVAGSELAWVARNGSKPGRGEAIDCWVLHASPEWSAAHQDLDREAVGRILLGAFARMASASPLSPIHLDAHFWRFAAAPVALDCLTLFDAGSGLVACGDWLAGGRVEGAFHSGTAAAVQILRHAGGSSDAVAPRRDAAARTDS